MGQPVNRDQLDLIDYIQEEPVVSEYSHAASLGDETPQNRPKSRGSRDRYTGPQCHPCFCRFNWFY
jgi:hypothetical protein